MNSIDGLEAHHCLTSSIECFRVISLLFCCRIHSDLKRLKGNNEEEAGLG